MGRPASLKWPFFLSLNAAWLSQLLPIDLIAFSAAAGRTYLRSLLSGELAATLCQTKMPAEITVVRAVIGFRAAAWPAEAPGAKIANRCAPFPTCAAQPPNGGNATIILPIRFIHPSSIHAAASSAGARTGADRRPLGAAAAAAAKLFGRRAAGRSATPRRRQQVAYRGSGGRLGRRVRASHSLARSLACSPARPPARSAGQRASPLSRARGQPMIYFRYQ